MQRQSHLERVTHAADNTKLWKEVEPKRERDRISRILPSPPVSTIELPTEGFGFYADRLDFRFVQVKLFGGFIPTPAGGAKELLIELDKPHVLPVAILVVGPGRHEFLTRPQIQPGVVEKCGHHGGARTMHSCDNDRHEANCAMTPITRKRGGQFRATTVCRPQIKLSRYHLTASTLRTSRVWGRRLANVGPPTAHGSETS